MGFVDPDTARLGTEPINPSAPAGETVRYDPDFERLSNEIVKIESITPVPIDWSLVVDTSSSLLRSKSKDFRLASYLAFGLLQKRGYEGLLTGLDVFRNLLRNFWETGFPEKSRMRGRIG